MSKAEENLKLLNEVYGAFFRGDIDGWLSFFDEKSVFWEAPCLPYGGVSVGVEQIHATVLKVLETWDDFDFKLEDMVANDNRVIAYGRIKARSKKTGKKMDVPLAEMWVFENGKVKELVVLYADTHAMVEALN